MNLLCKILGHNYDKSDKYRQDCKRKYCLATRWLVINQYKQAIGEKCIEWEYTDLDNIKIR